MSEFISSLTKVLTDQAHGLRRHRRCDDSAAWTAIRDTARGNLADSGGTDGEVYWRETQTIMDFAAAHSARAASSVRPRSPNALGSKTASGLRIKATAARRRAARFIRPSFTAISTMSLKYRGKYDLQLRSAAR